MSISSEIARLQAAKTAIESSITNKGVTIPSNTTIDSYSGYIDQISGGKSTSAWVRPSDWLVLPTVSATDQKFVGLHAVYPDANFVALTAAGDYTVNWGDGTIENFTANSVAQHEYDYTTYDTANATLSSRGYKQVVVVVTPQSGGNLTYLNLHKQHSALSIPYSSGFLDIALASEYLTDLRIGVQTSGSFSQVIRFADLERVNIVRSDLRTLAYLFYSCYSLQSVVDIATSTKTAATLNVAYSDSGDLVISAGHGLRDGDYVIVKSIATTTGLTIGAGYYVVQSTINTFGLSSSYGGTPIVLVNDGSGSLVVGTSMYYMFNGCISLTTVPLFTTSSVISMSYMFSSCISLTTVPLFDTSSVINMSYMFNACYLLTTIPLFTTSSVISMGNMFNNCYSLTTVPLFDTSSVTNMSWMFGYCYSLTTVPLFDTSSVMDMSSMFNNCGSLTTVPLFTTSSVKNMSYMFNSCSSLTTVPLFDTSSVTNMGSMFFNCISLTTVPPFTVSSVTSMGGMINNCFSISKISMTGAKVALSVAYCKLSADRLNEVYTNLGSVTGITITVSGNYGVATDNPSIATTKGWTVVG